MLTEHPILGFDILCAIDQAGGIDPKPYGYKGGEYDDKPKLSGMFKQVMSRGGMAPDRMASVINLDGYGDGTTSTMWRLIEQAAGARSTANQIAGEPGPELIPDPKADEGPEQKPIRGMIVAELRKAGAIKRTVPLGTSPFSKSVFAELKRAAEIMPYLADIKWKELKGKKAGRFLAQRDGDQDGWIIRKRNQKKGKWTSDLLDCLAANS